MEKILYEISQVEKIELLELVKKWSAEETDLRPGWDPRAAHKMAKEKCGGSEGFL